MRRKSRECVVMIWQRLRLGVLMARSEEVSESLLHLRVFVTKTVPFFYTLNQ